MAETLTMESNVETTTIDNLSTEEQDSLKVGEQMQEAQDQLLAGKYKNAEELEKGYLELQQKLRVCRPFYTRSYLGRVYYSRRVQP